MFTDAELKTLGSRLATLREALKKSATQVAREALGSGSHTLITRLERGQIKAPQRHHLEQLAAYYAIPAEHLMVHRIQPASTPAAVPATPAAPAAPHARAATPMSSGPIAVRRAPGPATPAPAPALRSMGARIAFVRRADRLDEADYAVALRRFGSIVTSGDVMAWERDERAPNPVQLHAIARHAERPTAWFETGRQDDEQGRGSAWNSWLRSISEAHA